MTVLAIHGHVKAKSDDTQDEAEPVHHATFFFAKYSRNASVTIAYNLRPLSREDRLSAFCTSGGTYTVIATNPTGFAI